MAANGTSGSEKTWTYARTDAGSTRYVTVTSPENHEITYTFNNLGQQTQAIYRNAANGDIQQIIRTTWSGGKPSQIDTQMGGVTRRTTMFWAGYDELQFQEDSDWYPANGSLIPRTKIIYSYTGFFSSPWLRRPSSVELLGWNGSQYVQQGLTQYVYDEYQVSGTPSNVPNKGPTPHNERGSLTTIRRHKDGSGSNYVEEHFHYDDLGNVLQTVDALGHSTYIGYQDNFTQNPSLPTFAFPTVVTRVLNQTNYSTSTTYDYNTGLVKSSYDLRNLETRATYDQMNRPVTVTEPNGRETTYTYADATPAATEEVLVADGKKRKTETTFDKLNRPIQTRLYDPAGDVFMDTQYDGDGRVKKVSQPYRSGEPIVWTETTYDVLNRPLAVTNPDSSHVTFVYDGNAVTTTDEVNNQRRLTSNAAGQLTKVEEPNPTLSNPLETTYSYYVFGPLAQVAQGSQTRTYTSDWLARITQEVHPETGTTNYSYYDNGMLHTRTDARNITTTYSYDALDRLEDVDYGDSTPDVHYDYDDNGFTGLLTAVSVLGVTGSTLEYNTNSGLLKKETVTLNGVSGSFATEYTYDYDGRLLTSKYPSGRIVTQTYDSGTNASDRLSALTSHISTETPVTLLQSVQDNASGAITSRTLSTGITGITETRAFNARNQLTRIAAAANSATLLDLGYGYGTNNDGRIRARTDAVQPEHSANYTFDEIGRLKEVSGGDSSWDITWELDRYGNRTSQTPSGLASGRVGSQSIAYYNNQNTASSLHYDAAGNLDNEGAGGHTYTYDAENRVIQVDSSATQYAYDSAGRRIKKTAGAVTTYYFYGLTGLTSEFSTESGATGAASTDRLQYRVGEQTGTAVMMVDSNGVPRENNRVFPFGEPWVSFTASNNSEKFTTYRRDNESQLDYAGARHYAFRSGRFMSPDPGHAGASIGDPQSWNAYAYALNDSINLTDPTGRCPEDDIPECVVNVTTSFPGVPFNPALIPSGYCLPVYIDGIYFGDYCAGGGSSGGGDPGGGGGGGGGGGTGVAPSKPNPVKPPNNPPQQCVNGFMEPTPAESLAILAAGEKYLGTGYMDIGQCTGFVCKSIQASLNAAFQKNGIVADVVKNPGLKSVPSGSQRAGDVVVFGSSHMGFYNPSPRAKNKTWTTLSAQGRPGPQLPNYGVQYGSPTWFSGTITYYRVLKRC